jgi:flagellar hook-length control protein FliK
MLPVNFGFDPTMSLNAALPAPKGGSVTPAATGPGSFHNMLCDAAAARAEAPAKSTSSRGQDAMNKTDRGASGAARDEEPVQSMTAHGQNVVNATDRGAAAAATAEAPATTAPAHGEDVATETGCGAAAADSHIQLTRRSAANDTEGQPGWALLAQIIQNLIATADTNAVAVAGEGAAAASDPAAGAAAASAPAAGAAVASDSVADTRAAAGASAEVLAALVDLLKQLQESPASLTAETAIPLDRLRQMLEQYQAGANESRPAGLPGRLLDLLKNVQEALPGVAWDRWAAALAGPDGASEKVLFEKATPADAGSSSAAVSQPDGLPVGAGRTARGVLLAAKGTQIAAGKADAAVPADALTDQNRPAADNRGPGAGRVLPAPPTAASAPMETLRSTAASSKVQASEGSFVLPKNFESAPDTQSEVSDDSRSPADKATAGLALSTADQVAEESGAPSLRFDAALRDVRGLALPEGSPDKPADAAAAAKGRDAAAAPVKADVFDQIVQRAAVHVKSGQGEMRIDLKPEFLGHVRLQIVTENQQVTVRILTELPMVRDMIESSIQQLKSDLQQQGLRVERVEVAVADDPRQHPGRQARNGAGQKGHADGDAVPAAAEIGTGLRPEASYRWSRGGQTTINMFA